MLINEAISLCTALTGQVVDNAVLVRWLSELDGRLAFEFYRTDAWTAYDATDDLQHELLVPYPWDGFYVHHLAARTYFANGEYDRYENERVMAEQELSDFRHFMQRTQAIPCRPGFPTDRTGGSAVTVIPAGDCGPWFWISAYSLAVKHGYQGTEEEWIEEQRTYVQQAEDAADAAETQAGNAASSAAAAAGSATAAAQSASGAASSASSAGTAATNAASAKAAAESAKTGAQAAQTGAQAAQSAAEGAASDAADSAEDSEAWAVGQRGGADVPATDETYHNNAKYWAAQAESAAGGGVMSFNGRTGYVLPAAGDYSAADVGAVPTTRKVNGKALSSDVTLAAADVGADPTGTAAAAVAAAVATEIVTVTFASFSTLPQSINNAAITADHVVLASELGNPTAQAGAWRVTTAAGSVTVSGSINGATTLTLILGKSGTSIS